MLPCAVTNLIPAELLTQWQRAADTTDAHFRKALSAHRPQIQCAAGCSMCCHYQLTVRLVEALALLQTIEKLPDAVQSALRRLPSTPDGERGCALLVDDQCVVHAGRPLVCRSYGLPVRQRDLEGAKGSTLSSDEISCCPLNFLDGTYSAETLVDALTTTADLAAANEIVAARLGASTELRISLRELARRGRDALPDDVAAALLAVDRP